MAERTVHHPHPAHSLAEWGFFTQGAHDAHNNHRAPVFNPPGTVIRGQFDQTELDLISIESPQHTVLRTPEHVAATAQRHIFSVMLAGRSIWTPHGHAQSTPLTLDPHQIGYWTSEVPYHWNFKEPFTLLALRVPFSAINIPHTTLAPFIGTTLPSDRGIAQYLIPFTEQIVRDQDLLATRTGTRLMQHVVDLFTTVLAGELDAYVHPDTTAPSFQRVTEYLLKNIHLTVPLATIARDNDMSVRYIQSLFQKRGTTLSTWLRTQRLELARQLLADPTHELFGIGAIAHQCGFSDHGHFTRAFRSRYRESPSEWRARTLS